MECLEVSNWLMPESGIAEVDWADVQPFHDHQYFLGRAGRNQQPATGAIRFEQSDSVEISLVYGPMLN